MEQGVIDKPECPVQHKDEGISFPTILMVSITSSKGIISAYPATLILAEFNAFVADKIFFPRQGTSTLLATGSHTNPIKFCMAMEAAQVASI